MNTIDKAINYLKNINNIAVLPSMDKEDLFRSLMNITMPINLFDEFYNEQDEILQEQLKNKRIIDVNELIEVQPQICLFLGDITTLKADAIVNACNEKLLGCFHPLHKCIDNAIHSSAGLQVRRDLMEVMAIQGYDEANGKCKATKGYNLPSKYILHTVGPQVNYSVKEQDRVDLENCYLSCLNKANEMGLNNVVFSSISTGIYGFSITKASRIAIKTVKSFLKQNPDTSIKRVVFDVFSKGDYEIYEQAIREIY